MADRPKAPRGKNLVLEGVRQNSELLQTGFGDFFAAAEHYNPEPEGVPLGQVFDAGIDAALTRTKASQRLGPVQARKEVAHQQRQEVREREADSATRAAEGVLADVEADASSQLKAQADATVANLSIEELAALREAVQDAEIERLGTEAFDYSEQGESDSETLTDADTSGWTDAHWTNHRLTRPCFFSRL